MISAQKLQYCSHTMLKMVKHRNVMGSVIIKMESRKDIYLTFSMTGSTWLEAIM